MTKGPRRVILDQYLDTAAEGRLTSGGADWKRKAADLKTLGEALQRAAEQAGLRIGEQTLTGPALRAGMEKSATSLVAKAEQLRTAGEALVQVGRQISDTRDARDAFADLGEKPPVYQAPAGTPGVEPTEDELAAQAAASQARQSERNTWQDAFDQQEAKARRLTQQLDAAFLGAIPPMKEIHGRADPTEPPPNVPPGPGGTYLPGSQTPPVTGGGNGNDDDPHVITDVTPPGGLVHVVSPPTDTVHPTYVHPELPTTTVTGTEQTGVTYTPTGPQVSAPTGGSVGPSAAALGAAGAAGGAGGLAAGAVRGVNAPLSATRGAGASPVRAIGSTGRAGSAGALSRPTGPAAATARGASAAGSPAGRGANSAAGRGAAAGSTAGRGSAGGRGAGGAGSRAGTRGAAGSTGGGRGGRKGERDAAERDSLVYDQDWLGDDDVAPGVLD